jgi:hypothetical protein
MQQELAKRSEREIDGFDGHTVECEGAKGIVSSSVIVGGLLRFGTDAPYWSCNDEAFPSERELAAVNVLRVVTKWVDEVKVEEIILQPNQRFPDLEKLNAEAPKSEWVERFGKMQGPWQGQQLVYFLDPHSMDRFTWPARITTIGASRAVGDLVVAVKTMRRLRDGQHVIPIVRLSDVHMPTAYGGRQRPDLKIVRWVTFGAETKALPADNGVTLQPVQEPTLTEEMGDEIPHR